MNFKKVLKGGLASLLMVSMTACSNSSDDGTIKIGGSGPLTGDAAVYGTAVKNAAQLAVDEINEAGVLQFSLNFQDDKADGETATTAYNTLVDWGMQVGLGTTTSGAGQVVSPLYAEDNIFAITPSASSTGVVYQDADKLTNAYGNVFQMCFTDPNLGTASAQYISEHGDMGNKIAVIYRNDDNYSTGIYNTFVKEADKLGLEIVSVETFTDGASDFSVQVSKAASSGADVLFLPIYYQPASLILAEANKQGYEPTFFGCDGMDGILTQDGFDTSLAEGLYMLTPFSADATDEKTVNFVTKYKELYGEVPNQFAADAYDAVYAIAAACEKAGVTSEMDASEVCDKLVSEFTSMTFDGVTGKNVTWSETGEVSKSPKAVVIQNGSYVGVE